MDRWVRANRATIGRNRLLGWNVQELGRAPVRFFASFPGKTQPFSILGALRYACLENASWLETRLRLWFALSHCQPFGTRSSIPEVTQPG